MKTKSSSKTARRLMPWLTGSILLIVWQIFSSVLGNASLLLPAPSDIAASLVRYHSVIWPNALYTLATTLVGFFLAVAAGLLLGLAVGASVFVYNGLYPLLIAFNAVPKAALVPVFVLWFGIGTTPAIMTAFSLAFFPIVVNVATGLATIEPEMEDVMRSLGASRFEVLTKVGIPRSMPYLFASLKISITLAFVGTVISETMASNDGIGFVMQAASARFDVALVFAGLVVIAAMAIAAYVVCDLIEKHMTGWAFRGSRN
jgi:NitT/TauT family transport system permease protein